MSNNQKFFICKVCGNLVSFIENQGVPLFCCGEDMQELISNTEDAATEKHLPEAATNGNEITIMVGSVAHPMAEEHYISFIYLETEHGGQMKYLKPGDAPKVSFCLMEDKPLTVFAYCNIHGLWKTELS